MSDANFNVTKTNETVPQHASPPHGAGSTTLMDLIEILSKQSGEIQPRFFTLIAASVVRLTSLS